jgi:hypothetical protein
MFKALKNGKPTCNNSIFAKHLIYDDPLCAFNIE